ncbi:amino acid-binding protein [Desulfovibrio aminophilus]|nr:phage regulatory CII family protein [Desulfovibrio aminophilus]MCM0755743.1 amino acid-binding protein [Desulfovibrio aminophilus]
MKGEIVRLAQQAVLEGGRSAREVAEAIGKPYSTLLRELNPFDIQAKLGAETLLEIMRVTRNVDPLRTMAKALGFELVGVCLPARGARNRRRDGSRAPGRALPPG